MHCRILQNHVRDLALSLGHIGKGAGLRCLQSALNNAIVLYREETFRNEHPQQHAKQQRAECHA
ncbi:Uncharacterised protein [Shigella sonnei]|nr:Uncharacterised protein [Shigella sonnei]CSG33647.1 Uncharacterised protein [Shigella sonnei]CSG37252.1 Uncharacterised protein [Shigella sonnei]CSQ78760.1 Uncharacterised protein [Shigella sonnei]CSS43019.1 Uncharacterised protein [Shigella sonnei]